MRYERYTDLRNGEIRPEKNGISTNPRLLNTVDQRRMPWFETEEEIKAGLAWGEEKAKLLKRARARMARRLTPVERRSIELFYFKDMNYREVAAALSLNVSSVYRAIQRGLRKLKQKRMASPAKRGRKRKALPAKRLGKRKALSAKSHRKKAATMARSRRGESGRG